MERMEEMENFVLSLILSLAVVFDFKGNRIPNRLCLLGGITGILFTLYKKGVSGLSFHLLWAAGFGLLFSLLWTWNMIGGGDVKLIIMAALVLGNQATSFLLCSGMCVGIHALLIMMTRKNYQKRMGHFFQYFMKCFQKRRILPYEFDRVKDVDDGGIRITYGLLAGHLLALAVGMY